MRPVNIGRANFVEPCQSENLPFVDFLYSARFVTPFCRACILRLWKMESRALPESIRLADGDSKSGQHNLSFCKFPVVILDLKNLPTKH
jgi:hypothetical protein